MGAVCGVLGTMAFASSVQRTDDAGPARPRAAFVTLGTRGGPIVAWERAEPANAVVAGKSVYLFDAGDGVQRQLVGAKLSLDDLRAVFISHHHIDHNAGVGPLIVTRWVVHTRAPLPIFGPPGTVDLVRGLVGAYHVTELAPLGPSTPLADSVKPSDLPANPKAPVQVYADENIRVLAMTNAHYHFPPGSDAERLSRSYSYRIETSDRVIVYTGDTGPSPTLVQFAKGADLLVSEVIDLPRMVAQLRRDGSDAAVPGLVAHMEQDHLTPEEVGKLAASAGVKAVVLTHLVPGDDGEADLSGYVTGVIARYRGPVHVAKDLERF